MTQTFKKWLIISISCVLLAAILLGCYFTEQTKAKESERQTASLTQKIQPLVEQKNALQNELRALEEEHARETAGKSCVLPVFTSSKSSLCSLALPLFQNYGATGIIAFSNNLFVGDAGQISMEEYHTLIGAGWETALGDDSTIVFRGAKSTEEVLKTWTAYLDNALKKMEQLGMQAPKLYCFNQSLGELSRGVVINALRERGFEGMVLPKVDEAIVGENFEYNGFKVIGSKRIFDNGSTVSTLFAAMGGGGKVTAVSVRELTTAVTDSNFDCSTERYEKMLRSVGRTYKELTLKNFSEFKEYRKSVSSASNENSNSYEQKRLELSQKIEALEKEINQQAVQ